MTTEEKNKIQKDVQAVVSVKKPKFPEGYDYELAIELALPVITAINDIDKADPKSIRNALYLMCVNGYYVHLNHCAFIIRKDVLTMQSQYQGRIMRARRDFGLVRVEHDIVYKGDTLEIFRDESGRKSYRHTSAPFHERKVSTENIVGAWCYLYWADGNRTPHEMTIDQIKEAWSQGKTGMATHNKFPAQMVTKTVISGGLTVWGNTNPRDTEVEYDEAEIETVQANMPSIAPRSNALPASDAVYIAPQQKAEPQPATRNSAPDETFDAELELPTEPGF